MQGPIFIHRRWQHINIFHHSAMAWKELCEYRYMIIYGYKKKLYTINLSFSPEDFPHMAGFQYLKDISLPNYTSSQVINRIFEGKITFEQIQKSQNYEKMIKPRLEAIIHLKYSLDTDFTLYSYMPKMYPFITSIKADYLIVSRTPNNSYIFIINTALNSNMNCDFSCCSAFKQGERNYEINQRPCNILKKERIHLTTNTIFTFFDRISLTDQQIQSP